MKRRVFLALAGMPFLARGAKPAYAPVVPGYRFSFPRDHGAHPDFRVEWWYVTGWLNHEMGFQITFFRARPE